MAGFGRGYPDGSAIDSEGFIWNCRFGGGCIVRIAPDGSIDRVIEMPVTNPTTATFGGDDLKTLFVTSAEIDAPDSERLAGSLFAVRSSVAGLPENPPPLPAQGRMTFVASKRGQHAAIHHVE